jgi:hypothetical protein
MSEFEVGDRVKWVWCTSDRFTSYIGKKYTIDVIDDEYEYPYHLKEVDRWVPGYELEKVEKDLAPTQDRFTLTVEQFGADGKKYVSGCHDITKEAFDKLWCEYINI